MSSENDQDGEAETQDAGWWVDEVFVKAGEQIWRDSNGDDDHQTDWGDISLLRQVRDATGSDKGMLPEIADDIRHGSVWGDALAQGLVFTDAHTDTKGKTSATRRRLRHALNMLNHFMGMHPDLAQLSVRDDIGMLGLALDQLDSGVVHPLLDRPRGAGNKPPDTKLDQQFQAYAVAFVIILEQAGYARNDALEKVAAEFTEVGYRASRVTEKNPSPNFRASLIRRWYFRAKPKAELEVAVTKPENDRKLRLGQNDSHAVGKLIISFVSNAVAEGEPMPPSRSYVLRVIRATLRDPTFKRLFPPSA